ncbi:MAG: hypothetical protein ACP5HG_13975 [Anaerolineae bacterium]
MAKTNKQRVLDYLQSIAPDYVTNADIREATGVEPHQQVYMLTQELKRENRIEGEQRGRVWFFRAASVPVSRLGRPQQQTVAEREARADVEEVTSDITPAAFEHLAGRVMSRHFGVRLGPDQVNDVPKRFDFVSPDGRIVGDAKYYTLVGGERLPPAKFSVIAEHVWLLEKTGAPTTFLVFGNDRRVPELWLARYGQLVDDVGFFFLTDEGELERLVT